MELDRYTHECERLYVQNVRMESPSAFDFRTDGYCSC